MLDVSVAKVAFMNGEYEKAARMFLDLARDGDTEAAFNYGYCLMHGYGVSRNEKEARSFFSFALELDGGFAAYNLASLYLSGLGGAKNFRKAVDLMKTAASKGCIEAQLYLGMVYTLGVVIDPDIVSISLIPYHTPEYRTDTLLLEGDVSEDAVLEEEERVNAVRQDPHAAVSYFAMAARGDTTYVKDLVSKGKYMYAKCYADGFGVEFDREKSARLMLVAGKSGSEEALVYLEERGVTREMLGLPPKKD